MLRISQYIAEGIFSRFGSGSNFDDAKERQGAGMNGLGIKVVAALSSKLELVCRDGKQEYKQTFAGNLSSIAPPEIRPCKTKPLTVRRRPRAR